jgi:hypothetical protein
MFKLVHLCIVALGFFAPIAATACSVDPPKPAKCFTHESPAVCTLRSRDIFEKEQKKRRAQVLAAKRQYDLANQTRWWREATEVQLVEVIGSRGDRARLVRPISWLKGRGYERTLMITDLGHYDPCPPTRGPLGHSRRGDLFIVFVFPRPDTLSFDYKQTALSDVAIPQLAAAIDAYQARVSKKI